MQDISTKPATDDPATYITTVTLEEGDVDRNILLTAKDGPKLIRVVRVDGRGAIIRTIADAGPRLVSMDGWAPGMPMDPDRLDTYGPEDPYQSRSLTVSHHPWEKGVVVVQDHDIDAYTKAIETVKRQQEQADRDRSALFAAQEVIGLRIPEALTSVHATHPVAGPRFLADLAKYLTPVWSKGESPHQAIETVKMVRNNAGHGDYYKQP